MQGGRGAEGRKGFVFKLKNFDFIFNDTGSHWAVTKQNETFYIIILHGEEAWDNQVDWKPFLV